MRTESAEELRTKIANYKATLRTAAPSMHRWLEALIADAEGKLRQLGDVAPAADATPGETSRSALSAHRLGKLRSTYPLDANAPHQRV